jgi:hypothetical protein
MKVPKKSSSSRLGRSLRQQNGNLPPHRGSLRPQRISSRSDLRQRDGRRPPRVKPRHRPRGRGRSRPPPSLRQRSRVIHRSVRLRKGSRGSSLRQNSRRRCRPPRSPGSHRRQPPNSRVSRSRLPLEAKRRSHRPRRVSLLGRCRRRLSSLVRPRSSLVSRSRRPRRASGFGRNRRRPCAINRCRPRPSNRFSRPLRKGRHSRSHRRHRISRLDRWHLRPSSQPRGSLFSRSRRPRSGCLRNRPRCRPSLASRNVQ